MRKLISRACLAGLLASATGVLTTQAAAALYLESGGVVAVEAEHVADRTDQPDDPFHRWTIVPTEDAGDQTFVNARGNQYVQVLPNTGDNASVPERVQNPPWTDYYVEITTSGVYRLWLRWGGYSGDSDSMYAAIVELKDGFGGTHADWYRYGRSINDVALGDNDFNRGWDGNGGYESNSGDAGGVPTTWNIQHPGIYTVRLTMREDAAAVDTILLQRDNLAAPGNPGPAESSSVAQFVRITTAPLNRSVSPGQTATFTVAAETTGGTITYEWQSKAPGAADFTNLAGASAASYTTPAATAQMSGTQYRVVLSNGTRSTTSIPVTLVSDATPPAITRIVSGPLPNQVTITFSENVDAASAGATGAYTINGVTVSSATVVGDRVILNTSAQTPGTAYNLTVNGVKDAIGNTLTGGTGTFRGAVRVPGFLRADIYRALSGTTVNLLTNSAIYPNSPTETTFWTNFGPYASGNPLGDNYGARVTGFIVPPVSGLYKFYLRSDDSSELRLSTGDTPSGLRTIAEQAACCNAFTEAEGTLSSEPINLTAGQRYYVEGLVKEGGGDDYIQVGWRTPNDPDLYDPTGLGPIPGEFLEAVVDPGATLDITQQPVNVSVAASAPATFRVGFNANSVLFGTNATVQWQKAPAGSSTFTDIAGGSGATLMIPFALPADNNAKYRAVLSIGNLTNRTSAEATLTVTGETTPPQVTGATADASGVTLFFNEPLDPASVTTGAFSIAGAAVTGATVTSAAGQAATVRVSANLTAGQQYTVNLTGLRDVSGNTMAAGASRSFTAFDITENFSGGVPTGAGMAGSASITPAGELQLTANAISLQGGFTFGDVLNGGTADKFTATFKLFIGNGSGNPADGFSFNVAPDLMADPTTPPTYSEEGTGSGLTVAFDTYDNGAGEAPAISLKFGSVEFTTTNLTKAALVNNQWVDVVIKVDADGTIDVQHNNVKYFDNFLVEGWTPISAPQVGFGARTGGEFAAHRVDDVNVLFNADITLPQPPTIAITSPTANQVFPAGSSVTLQVDARDPEGQITKVEFFANGNKIGESTTAPYSFAVPNAPQGVYFVTARITDAQGLSVTSGSVKAIVGNPGKILFVHGAGGPNTSDNLLINHLIGRGFDPVLIAAPSSTTEDATGKLLVIVSSSVASGDVAEKFLAVAVPVVQWENALQDNFLFTLDQDGTTRGAAAGQTTLEIMTPTHPIAGGLTGVIEVANPGVEITWGTPAPAVIPIARLSDGSGRLAIYAFETGALLVDGATTAAARRVHLGGGDGTYAGMNSTGRQLWHNAIDWALGTVQPPARPTATITRSGGNITIGSSDGGTVQASNSLVPAAWTDLGAAPQTIPTSDTMRFFRIRK